METHRYARLVILLVVMSLFMSTAVRADDDAGDATGMMPADAATHGQPMKMSEPMPTKMKKDGMMKEDVMKGEMAKNKIMDETLKGEESTMEKHDLKAGSRQ